MDNYKVSKVGSHLQITTLLFNYLYKIPLSDEMMKFFYTIFILNWKIRKAKT